MISDGIFMGVSENSNQRTPNSRGNCLFLWLGVGVLFYSLIVGVTGFPVAMGIGAFLSMALLLLSMMDRFSSFKATTSGVEAVMRATAEEAQKTIEATKRLGLLLARLQIEMIVRANRMNAYKETEKNLAYSDLLKHMEELGATQAELYSAMTDVRSFTRFDLYRRIAFPRSQMHPGISHEFRSEWLRLANKELGQVYPTADQFEEFFKRTNLWTPEEQERVEDYRYYLKHEELRRPLSEEN